MSSLNGRLKQLEKVTQVTEAELKMSREGNTYIGRRGKVEVLKIRVVYVEKE